jgi:hypothetical protein
VGTKQNPIDHPDPIINWTCTTKGWWCYYIGFLVGGFVLVILLVGYHIANFRELGVVKNLPSL